jgi:rRNA maturation endonuclease Nob1
MKHCSHVYELVGSDLCPYCGKDTHENNSQHQEALRQAHIEKYGLFNQNPSWWSI